MDNLLLYSKLSHLPDNITSEVSNFIDFLMSKGIKQHKTKHKLGSAKGMGKMKKKWEQPSEDVKA